MFGYIIINKGEMKFKDYDVYHGFYCGLCRTLKSQYGLKGQMTLSFDMTFLLVLLSGLYEPETTAGVAKCAAHPLEKHPYFTNECSEYVADMNLLLSYYKCLDDWHDERKYGKLVYSKALQKAVVKIKEKYPDKFAAITKALLDIEACEKTGDMDIDKMAGYFGRVMEEIFAYRQDEWCETLRAMGFFLGKYIYLADAYEDVEKDQKEGNYNPLAHKFGQPDFEQECRRILTMMMSECCRRFEILPIIQYTEILRNILYSGVWYRFDLATEKRKQQKEEIQEKNNAGSI